LFRSDSDKPVSLPCPTRRSSDLGVVDAHAQAGFASERGEPRDLRRADHLVADQHVADPALDERLGLGHLLAAHAHGAGSELPPRDLGALVGLGMGPDPDVAALERCLQGFDIALEGVELEDQRGRIDLVEALPHLGGRSLAHSAAARPARLRTAYQTMEMPTSAMRGSASRFTCSHPPLVTVRPALKEEIAIMMKIAWSFAPCAFARSSGRYVSVRSVVPPM